VLFVAYYIIVNLTLSDS